MARAKTGTAKRPTAAQKAEAKYQEKRRKELSKKLSDEIQVHNTLDQQITAAREELAQRKGRVGLIQEELQELGGPDESVMSPEVLAPDQPEAEEKQEDAE